MPKLKKTRPKLKKTGWIVATSAAASEIVFNRLNDIPDSLANAVSNSVPTLGVWASMGYWTIRDFTDYNPKWMKVAGTLGAILTGIGAVYGVYDFLGSSTVEEFVTRGAYTALNTILTIGTASRIRDRS